MHMFSKWFLRCSFLLVLCGFSLFLSACRGQEKDGTDDASFLSLEAGSDISVLRDVPDVWLDAGEQANAQAQAAEASGSQAKAQAEPETQALIRVFVCGAVIKPSVCTLPEGARVQDAVDAAGGFRADADREWLNLARTLADGEQIRVPTREETSAYADGNAAVSGMAASTTPGMKDGKIDLNTADAALLVTLPGIGEAKAAAIIAYREEHGGFSSAEEIMQISGIKQSIYEGIRDRITV